MICASDFSKQLLSWFDQNGRKDLPWQLNKTPYRVWVSEIMLQQTQVTSVITYYQRFMTSFPDIKSLADANEDQVLEHWAGLGYYARARNLHKAAKLVIENHQGNFPDTIEEIIDLPGIGRSTAGAILSIAFKQQATILDGNVKRVLCRLHTIDTWPGEKKTETKLWQIAESLTPPERTGDYTQAIMDLGATLCTRAKPDCLNCPFTKHCKAFATDLQSALPKSKPKKTIPQKHTWIAIIESDNNEVLLEKRPPTGIWGSLYSLPEIQHDIPLLDVSSHCDETFGGTFELIDMHDSIQHTFSHFKLELKPVHLRANQKTMQIRENSRFIWFKKEQLKKLGMPAPISKYLSQHLNLPQEA